MIVPTMKNYKMFSNRKFNRVVNISKWDSSIRTIEVKQCVDDSKQEICIGEDKRSQWPF